MERQPAVTEDENQFSLLGAVLERTSDSHEFGSPDGVTVFAAMKGMHRDIRALVATIVSEVTTKVGVKTELTSDQQGRLNKLVRSLALPFISQVVSRKGDLKGEDRRRFTESLELMASRIAVHIPLDDEQSYLKYWLNVALCRVFQDKELPVKDPQMIPNEPLFSGWMRLYLVRRIAKRDVSFVYSLTKGAKLGWPELSQKQRDKTLRKHCKALSRRESGEMPADLEEQILACSEEIFREAVSCAPSKLVPSTSACLQASRRLGGALGMFKPVEAVGENLGLLRSLTLSIDLAKRKLLREAEDRYMEDLVRGSVLRFNGQNFYDHRFAGHPVEPNDLWIVAIPEPGKFRIISKGNGNLYTALQPLQGEMLSAWKRSKYSTMLVPDLVVPIRKIDSLDGLWMSVDYESATDLLRRRATLLALQGVRRSRQYDLAEYSFSMGTGLYEFSDGSQERVLLGEGQPMGHPLSFPLLCVINLAVYRTALLRFAALKGYDDEWLRARWDAVLVNGDDMLFKSCEEFREVFYSTAAEAGFKISVGKNYHSADCCMMNSQVFQRRNGVMVRVGYLNQRLTNGINVKKGDGVSAAIPTQLGKDIGLMVKLAPWTGNTIPMAFSRFEKDYHGYRPNWYLPVHLGGFGLPLELAPADMKVTREQRRVAAQFINNPRLALYSNIRAGGTNDLRLSDLDSIETHWVVGDYVPTAGEAGSGDWLLDICLWNHLRNIVSEDADIRARIIRRDYRLKPANLSTIAKYWNARLVGRTRAPVEHLASAVFPRSLQSMAAAAGIGLDLPFDFSGAWGAPRRLMSDLPTRLAHQTAMELFHRFKTTLLGAVLRSDSVSR